MCCMCALVKGHNSFFVVVSNLEICDIFFLIGFKSKLAMLLIKWYMQWDFVNHLKCLTVNSTCLTVNYSSDCKQFCFLFFYLIIIIYYYHGSHCIIHNTTALRI